MRTDRFRAVGAGVLYEDEYVTVTVEDEGRLVRMTRSAEPFPDLGALEACYANVIAAYDQVGRNGRSLFVDVRAPKGRNDPQFEQAMRPLLPLLDRGYERIGVLIMSATGKLQMGRWSNDGGIKRLISTDEAEILRYLRGANIERDVG